MTAAEVAALKAACRASLQDAIAVIHAKPKNILLDALRREFVAVLKVFDAEDALKAGTSTSTSTSTSPAATSAAKPKATAPATKKNRPRLLSLLQSWPRLVRGTTPA